MEETYFHSFFIPELKEPFFVVGLPGFGNVGNIAAKLMIKFCRAKIFAELYSPSFPDFVSIDSAGICHLPRYEFYSSSIGNHHFIILTGNAVLPEEDILAHHKLCGEILDFLADYNSKYVVATGGLPTPKPAGEVYVAATSSKLASEIARMGARIYPEREIREPAGLMVGLAKNRGWDGVCILGATTGLKADRGSGFSVFKFLTKMFKIEKIGS